MNQSFDFLEDVLKWISLDSSLLKCFGDCTLGETGLSLSLSVLSLSSELMASTGSLGQGGNGVTIAQKGTLSLGLGLHEPIGDGDLKNVNHGRLISLARSRRHRIGDRGQTRHGAERLDRVFLSRSLVFTASLLITHSLSLVRSTFPTSRGLGPVV